MLKKYIRIYIECIKISISTALTYRLNFLLDNFIMLVSNILFPLFTLLIYGSGAEFPNWSLYEVLLIQAVFTMSTGIANILFNGVLWATMRHIIEGSLEIVLIKPVDCLFFLTASTIEFSSIGLFLGGLVIFVVALPHIGPVSILMVLQFIVLFLYRTGFNPDGFTVYCSFFIRRMCYDGYFIYYGGHFVQMGR